tara:strand:+ start:9386 stop:10555 length:1170 start_codon:yes stop_codon:yes gene_type:complete
MKIFNRSISFISKIFWLSDPNEKILISCIGLLIQNLPFFIWRYEDPTQNIMILRFISSIFCFIFIFNQTFFSKNQKYHFFLWVFNILLVFQISPLGFIYYNSSSYEWSLVFIISIFIFFYVLPPSFSILVSFGSIVIVFVFFPEDSKMKEIIFMGWGLSTIFSFIFLGKRQKYIQKLKEVHRVSVLTIVHEVTTPLASISLLTDTLSEKGFDRDDILQKIRSISNKTTKNIKMIASTVTENNNNLMFSKVGDVIKSVIEENKSSLYKNIRVSIHDDNPILTDSNILYFVFLNIIKNASFFCNKKKESYIEITSFQNKDKTFVIIKDNAIGIAKQKLPFIFEPFFSERDGGIGLGLYFCKQALKGLNANISCKSEFGHFTEFVIELRSLN